MNSQREHQWLGFAVASTLLIGKVRSVGEANLEMSTTTETKPKVEGGKNHRDCRCYNESNGITTTTRTEYKTKITGLEEDSYDVGEAKFAAKFQKSTKNIALYVQRKYTDGVSMAHDMKLMKVTNITLPSPWIAGSNGLDAFV